MLDKTKWSVNAASILCLLGASALPFRACRLAPDGMTDDAYITLCYAKNLAAGNGFVFNHGPPTLGTTTPLLTVIVACVGRLLPPHDIARVAACLTAVLWALLPWIILGFRRVLALQVWEAAVVGLFVLAFEKPYIGAEPILFQVLLVSAIALFWSRRCWTAGFASGLLVLCRGEGMLLVPVLGVLHCLHEASAAGWGMPSLRDEAPFSLRRPKRALMRLDPLIRASLGAAVPLLLWAIYAQAIFGHLIPQTLSVKMQQGKGLSFGSQFLGELLKSMRQWVVLGLPRAPGILMLQWVMVALGLWSVVARRRGWAPYVLWCIGYVAAYTALRVPGWYGRYRIPAYWCWTILCALGLIGCVSIICRPLRRRIRGSDVLAGGVTTALVFAVVMYRAGTAEGAFRYPRADVYLQVCAWMNENTDPSASLAAAEVGYLGYFTSNRIVDTAGLVLPGGSDYPESGRVESIMRDNRPDYFLRAAKDKRARCPERFAIGDLQYERVRGFRSSRHGDDLVLYKKTNPSNGPPVN